MPVDKQQTEPANEGLKHYDQVGKDLHERFDAGKLARESHGATAAEQKAMWGEILKSNGNSAAPHLPQGFSITGESGNYTVKEGQKTVYDEQKTALQAEKDAHIRKGEGSFDALKRLGMSDAEARSAAREINKEEHLGGRGHRALHVGDSVVAGSDGKMHLHHKGDKTDVAQSGADIRKSQDEVEKPVNRASDALNSKDTQNKQENSDSFNAKPDSQPSQRSLANGTLAEAAKATGDVAKAGGELLMTPLDSLYEGVKADLKTAATGLDDLAKGDLVGGVGHILAAPFVGAEAAAQAGLKRLENAGGDLLKAGQHVGRGLVQGAEGAVDLAKTAGDIIAAPITGTFAAIKGTLNADADGARMISNGDTVRGVERIVTAPFKGLSDGAHEVGAKAVEAATDFWHGLEHIF